MDSTLLYASIGQVSRLYRSRKLSPVELVSAVIKQIEELNPLLNAYLTVCAESALQQARIAERHFRNARSKREVGPLHGIPISLKDNIFTEGVRTTAGSRILRSFIPSQDAAVVTALKRAGAIVIGKTNMHEFAYGTTNLNPHFGPALNPWNRNCITGGSSGGSAASVASGLAFGSVGTDTGGSIRIPSALCGVVGLKPTVSRVSTEGVIPLSAKLDCVGPIARTVEDVTALFQAMAPSTSRGVGAPSKQSALHGKSRWTLGVPKEFFLDDLSSEVQTAFEEALRRFRAAGARLKTVSIPRLYETEDAGNQIAWAEATQFHQHSGWYPSRSAEYGEDVRSRLKMGTEVSAVTYLNALHTRENFITSFHEALSDSNIDALVAATTPITATPLDAESIRLNGQDKPVRGLLLRLNRPANLAGIPSLSLPCGCSSDGLPIGVQLMGVAGGERTLLEVGRRFEQSCPDIGRPALN